MLKSGKLRFGSGEMGFFLLLGLMTVEFSSTESKHCLGKDPFWHTKRVESTEWLQKVYHTKLNKGLTGPYKPARPVQPIFPFPVLNHSHLVEKDTVLLIILPAEEIPQKNNRASDK